MSSLGNGLNEPQNAALIAKVRAQAGVAGAAGWFLAIAGLSMVNSVIAAFGGRWQFIFGLGTTQIVDALAARAGATGVVLDLIINGFIAGIFVLFWLFARKGVKWVFIVGMIVYLLDGVLCLLFRDYFAAAFHGWALWRIYHGFEEMSLLNTLQEQEAATAGAPIQPL